MTQLHRHWRRAPRTFGIGERLLLEIILIASLWASRPILASDSRITTSNSPNITSGAGCVAIESIGHTNVTGHNQDTPMLVREHETVTVRIHPCFDRPAFLFAVTRQSGGFWEVQQGLPLRPGEAGLFRLPVRFGHQGEDLGLRDFRVLVHKERLAAGNVPDELLTNSGVVASSENITVQHDSGARPFVGLTHLDGTPLYSSTDLPWVGDEAALSIYASAVGPDARIGVAIRPTRPLNRSYWVQVDDLMQTGVLNAYFGDPGLHRFHRFEVNVFVAPRKLFPPRAVPIDALEWERYQRHFLATSTPVTVVKAGSYFSIEQIGIDDVVNGRVMKVPVQTDITGLLDHPLGTKSRVWIVCVPTDGSDPWVAPGIAPDSDSVWQGKAIRLWKAGFPEFQIVAVIDDDDPRNLEAAKIRQWINERRRSVNTVRARISSTGAGKR
jgi:hypothetical protein